MPCQSYGDDWTRENDSGRKLKALKKEADMLARIACKALNELEANGIEDLLLLKDDEVRAWWKKHKEDDAREQARVAELERKKRVREEALAKLSSEERELLGIETKKRSKKSSVIEDVSFNEDNAIIDLNVHDPDAEYSDDEIVDLGGGIKVRMIRR
jgi:hypothetical protein